MEIVILDTNIPDGAYRNRTDITSVVIESNVESIGEWAFRGCTALKEVLFKTRLDGENYVCNMQYIGTGAFYGCSNLTELNNIAGVKIKTISPYTFYNCSKLTDCPTGFDGLKSIGHYAYYGCSSLKTGVYSNYDNETTKIGDYAFYGTGIFEVNLVGKTVIGDYAFAHSEVTDVKLYNTTHIGKWAFYDCSKLKNVILGQALKHIGESAFRSCDMLHYILIPHGVQYIGPYTFYNLGSGDTDDDTIRRYFCLDFSTHTSIPALFGIMGLPTIGGLDYSGDIIVPDELYPEWKDAPKDESHWSVYSDYITRHSATNPYGYNRDKIGAPRIRFNINNIPFVAEEGMTWAKWCNSAYNNYALAGKKSKWGLSRFISIDDRTNSYGPYAYTVNWPCLDDVKSLYGNVEHDIVIPDGYNVPNYSLPVNSIHPYEKIVDGATYWSGMGAYVSQ